MATVKDLISVLEHFGGDTEVKLAIGDNLHDVGTIGEYDMEVEEGVKFDFVKISPMPTE